MVKRFLNRDRLTSIDLLQVKKLKEHVYQKILKLNETPNAAGTTASQETTTQNETQTALVTNNTMASASTASNISNDSKSTQQQDQSALIERTIEIICSDQVVFILHFSKNNLDFITFFLFLLHLNRYSVILNLIYVLSNT